MSSQRDAAQSKLGLHWVPAHVGERDLELFGKWQPPVVEIVDGDANRWAQAYAACPNAIFVARDWALSEQKEDVERDPAGTGRRHAEEWHEHLKALCPQIPADRVFVCGINEPPVWVEGGIARYVAYTVAFLDRLAELRRRGVALNLSVGWPGNLGPDMPPDWGPYAPVLEAIRRGGHVLGLHEYWDTRGPGYNWTWWAGRYEQCPWDCRIIVTECGLDQYVSNGGIGEEARGWQTNGVSREAYVGMLEAYDAELQKDSRILGACVFTWDFNAPWGSFDVRPVGEAFGTREARNDAGDAEGVGNGSELVKVVAVLEELRADVRAVLAKLGPAAPGEPAVSPLALCRPLADGVGGVTQWFGENAAEYARFGLAGHNGLDYGAPAGSAVLACHGGRCSLGYDEGGFGRFVRVTAEDGVMSTLYAHLAAAVVVENELVAAGQQLGNVGSTGNSTGPHLHLGWKVAGVRNQVYGDWVDPVLGRKARGDA